MIDPIITSNYYYTINEHISHNNLCSNLKFYNKFEALRFKKSIDNSEIFLNWFDNTWASFDYTQEPIETFEELKRQRALKIRDNARYLKLWFSGGVDSISALNTFLKNGIHIDEIAYWSRPINSWKHVNPDNEIIAAVEPYLKSIRNLIPNTKISKYQMTIEDVVNKTKRLYDQGLDSIEIGAPAELDITPEARDVYLSTQVHDDCVNLEGGSKPYLAKINNEWYFFSTDVASSFRKNADDFFFDSDDPRLYIKTLHTFSKYIDSLEYDNSKLKMYGKDLNKLKNKINFLPHIGRDRSIDDVAIIKHVLPDKFTPVLTINDDLRIRSCYVRNIEVVKAIKDHSEMTKVFDNWKQAITGIEQEFKEDFLAIPGIIDAAKRFKPVYSKFYCLKDRTKIKWRVSNTANLKPNTVLDNDIIIIMPF